ncbi:hypothetical protein [Thermoanaerobacterium sp. DL9XJH110]|uniref:hypothetical protein n=1 Tax=Thermoanaerobacterium sp. DL9XJH110 TaxID=3386643 RepID=UPI003BB4C208
MDSEKVMEILKEQLKILKKMLENSEKAYLVLRQEDTEMVADIYASSAGLMERFDKCGRKLAGAGGSINIMEYLRSDKGEAGEIYREIIACLNNIKNVDEENQRYAIKIKNTIQENIINLQKSHKAFKNYITQIPFTGGGFIDTKK